jgi:hypothetical protein
LSSSAKFGKPVSTNWKIYYQQLKNRKNEQ